SFVTNRLLSIDYGQREQAISLELPPGLDCSGKLLRHPGRLRNRNDRQPQQAVPGLDEQFRPVLAVQKDSEFGRGLHRTFVHGILWKLAGISSMRCRSLSCARNSRRSAAMVRRLTAKS